MKALSKSIVIVAALFLITSPLFAEIPHLISYQGKLGDKDGKPLTGSYNITFRIYDAETGGNLKWSEAHSGVVVNKGYFSLMLGSLTTLNLPFDQPYWLTIQVGGDPEMTPRQRLASSGYAYRAESAKAADNGVPIGCIIMWSGAIANIPNGWALCDGTNGTPDLRDKFVVGAGTSYNPGNTGGEVFHTLTIAEMPRHNHSHNYVSRGYGEGNASSATEGSDAPTSYTGGDQAHENRPPYYALAYIMRTN